VASAFVTDPRTELEALWLAALQSAADAAAHDIRNVLNAVAVNVEVVRSRAARGGEAAAAAAPFAETAASEFERATAAVEALLALVRPAREPVDVAVVLARMATLLDAGARTGRITVRRDDDEPTRTAAPGSAVRVAVACVLQSALREADGGVTCEVGGAGGIFLRVAGGADDPPRFDVGVAEQVARHGVTMRAAGPAIELRFPAIGH
jgi:signal transduction histidine kinase